MAVVFVIVKKVGKVRNVTYQRTNAKYQVATTMDAVLMVTAIANEDGKDNSAINVSKILIHFCPCLYIVGMSSLSMSCPRDMKLLLCHRTRKSDSELLCGCVG